MNAWSFSKLAVLFLGTGLNVIAHAQNDPVSEIRNKLLANGSFYAIKISGLHSTTDVLGRPSEIRIVNGAVARGASQFLHGKQDYAIAPGQSVHVQTVTTSTDSKKDEFKLELAAGGLIVPVAFVLPQGSLANMTEPQLQALVDSLMSPLTNTSYGQSVAPSAPGAPVAAPPRDRAPAPPPAVQPGLIGSKTFYLRSASSVDAPALTAFSKRCMSNNGLVMLKTDEFTGITDMDASRENIIVDGSLQPPPPGFFRGNRMANLHPGEVDRIVDVRAITDGEHDILHLTVRTSLPLFGNIAFVFPKDSLKTMTEAQMRSLVEPWINLPGTFRLPPRESDSL